MSSTGIDRRTGRPLRGWDHVVQSVFVILATPIGRRVMRRSFGFAGTGLIGRRFTPQVVALWRLALVLALERWEPRVRVRRIQVLGEVDEVRAGGVSTRISVDYLPDGHMGDATVAGAHEIEV
ncbi:GPW/gp25 family protein [Xanthobacter sediminis]